MGGKILEYIGFALLLTFAMAISLYISSMLFGLGVTIFDENVKGDKIFWVSTLLTYMGLFAAWPLLIVFYIGFIICKKIKSKLCWVLAPTLLAPVYGFVVFGNLGDMFSFLKYTFIPLGFFTSVLMGFFYKVYQWDGGWFFEKRRVG